MIVYTFLLPFSAVTVIVVVLSPGSIRVPDTLTVAFESFGAALTVSLSQSLPTDVVYVVTLDENAGESTPGLISSELNVLSVE